MTFFELPEHEVDYHAVRAAMMNVSVVSDTVEIALQEKVLIQLRMIQLRMITDENEVEILRIKPSDQQTAKFMKCQTDVHQSLSQLEKVHSHGIRKHPTSNEVGIDR